MKRYQTILVGAALDDRDAATWLHAARFAMAAGSKAVYVAYVAPSFDLPARWPKSGVVQSPAHCGDSER